MQEAKERQICQRLDIEFIIDEINKFLRRQTVIPNTKDFFITAFYPDIKKKQTTLQISFTKMPENKTNPNMSEFIVVLNQSTLSIMLYAKTEEVQARKIQSLKYVPLVAPTYEEYMEDFYPSSTYKTFHEMVLDGNSLEDILTEMLKELDDRLENRHGNIQRHEYVTTANFVLAKNCEKLGLPEEMFRFLHKMNFLLYPESEELQEWLPFPVYEKIEAKYEQLRKQYFENLKLALKFLAEHPNAEVRTMLKRLILEQAELNYNFGQFANLDEPRMSYDKFSPTGFQVQLQEFGLL